MEAGQRDYWHGGIKTPPGQKTVLGVFLCGFAALEPALEGQVRVLLMSLDGDEELDEVVGVVKGLDAAFIEEKIFAVVELGFGIG